MRLLLTILVSTALAYAVAFTLAVPANPEVKFWRAVDELRDQEIAGVREAIPSQPIIFFAGGSSCAFSIDPRIIEEACGMPAFNLGLPVVGGAKFLLHQALEKTRKGDILVVCLEPDLLTYPEEFKPGQFGFAMAVSRGTPLAAAGGDSFEASLGLREYLNLSRPGPSYLATLLAKSFSGMGYRYRADDIRYHGRIETPVSDPALPRVTEKSATDLSPGGRELLSTFLQAAEAKGVTLVYSMPWMLTEERAAETNRAANLEILDSIRTIFPSIDDGYQGVAVDPDLFSDSGLHLSSAGSAQRSSGLAEALHSWIEIRR